MGRIWATSQPLDPCHAGYDAVGGHNTPHPSLSSVGLFSVKEKKELQTSPISLPALIRGSDMVRVGGVDLQENWKFCSSPLLFPGLARLALTVFVDKVVHL